MPARSTALLLMPLLSCTHSAPPTPAPAASQCSERADRLRHKGAPTKANHTGPDVSGELRAPVFAAIGDNVRALSRPGDIYDGAFMALNEHVGDAAVPWARAALSDPQRLAALYTIHRGAIATLTQQHADPGSLSFVLREEVIPYFTAPIAPEVLTQNERRQVAWERMRAIDYADPCRDVLTEQFTIEDRLTDALTPNGDVLRWMLRRRAEGGPALIAAWGNVFTDIAASLPPPTVPEAEWSEDTGELRRFTSPHSSLIGYRDASGAVVIPAQFEDAGPFGEAGLADVRVIDTEPPYSHFHGTLWRIDASGTRVIQALYDDFGHDTYEEGLARFVADARIGFSDPTGRVVVPARYDWAGKMDDGIALVCNGCDDVVIYPDMPAHNTRRLGGTWGAVDRTGQELVPVTLSSSEEVRLRLDRLPNATLATHQNGDKFGFTDKDGQLVIPAIYDQVNGFADGRATVCRGCSPTTEATARQRWGIIDETGAVVVPIKHRSFEALREAEKRWAPPDQ